MRLMKKRIITIAGVPGSGKSSTADGVARELEFARFSSGDFMRNIALEMGISLNELGSMAETNQEIDRKIDEQVRNAGEKENIVVDSRLAFHFIPDSFKVFLDLPLEISKVRVFNSLQNNKLRMESEGEASIEKIYEKITARLKNERKRYKNLYGIEDHTAKDSFDLVVDTNKNNLDQVVKIIVSEYKKWLEEN